MKLEVGMFVRTKDGIIDKVIIDYEGHCNNPNCNCKHISCKYNYYDENKVIKASHNIIDLIEENDIIEYAPIHNGYEKKQLFCRRIKDAKDLICFKYQVEHNKAKIKSIVTKEQFESMSYKVDE